MFIDFYIMDFDELFNKEINIVAVNICSSKGQPMHLEDDYF